MAKAPEPNPSRTGFSRIPAERPPIPKRESPNFKRSGNVCQPHSLPQRIVGEPQKKSQGIRGKRWKHVGFLWGELC